MNKLFKKLVLKGLRYLRDRQPKLWDKILCIPLMKLWDYCRYEKLPKSNYTIDNKKYLEQSLNFAVKNNCIDEEQAIYLLKNPKKAEEYLVSGDC